MDNWHVGNQCHWPVLPDDLMPVLPSLNRVSSPYGWRVHPITGVRTFHTGTDFSFVGLSGLEIRAPQSGRIMHDGTYGGYGQAIILEAGKTRHLFGHTALVPDADVGDFVAEGQVIATIGSTGNSTGPHLHWEVRVEALRNDPMVWIAQFAAPAVVTPPTPIPKLSPTPKSGARPMFLFNGISNPTAFYLAVYDGRTLKVRPTLGVERKVLLNAVPAIPRAQVSDAELVELCKQGGYVYGQPFTN